MMSVELLPHHSQSSVTSYYMYIHGHHIDLLHSSFFFPSVFFVLFCVICFSLFSSYSQFMFTHLFMSNLPVTIITY